MMTNDQGQKSKFDWLHKVLDVAGLVVDAADIVNAGICVASALPVIGTAVAGVTRVTKFAKAGKVIEKTLKLAGKTYATVQAATAALEMAGDAKIQYAANGGRMTLGIAAKIVGATAMTAISVAAAGSLIKDVTSLSKVSDISLNTSSQKSADLESGRCAKGNGIGCFIAGTKVKTVNGEKNIEDVETGDYVLAENPETVEQEYKKVVRTYIHEKTTLVHVFIGEEEIKTTVEHPFYVEGIGFVSAGELRAGDIIRTSDGENLPVDKVELESLEEPVLVYNFEVEDFHTYYVSGLGVLVHNDCGANFYVGPAGAATSLKEYDEQKKFCKWLNKGKANNKVYFGIKKNKPVYTGITRQRLEDRLWQHNHPAKGKFAKGFSRLHPKFSDLTRNQARAIEQYYIENGPNKMNLINSISPKSKYYDDAKNWATKYINAH